MNTTESEDGSVGPLREAFTVCAAAGMSGILRVTGHPGGAVHITDGLVAAIETPGAPGPEALLLRSHRVLAALPARSGRDRIVAATGAVRPGVRLGDGQDEILALADGRRTARDLAFALGRGVYATMLQLSRMQRAGLLVAVPSRAADAAAAQARRPANHDDLPPAAGLPRRQRDMPGASRRQWVPGRAPELRTPLSLLRPRAARDETS